MIGRCVAPDRAHQGGTSPMAAGPIARLRPLARSSWPIAACKSALAPKTAVEMTRPWKSQNDFHSRLEIAHRTRDFHIPTATSGCRSREQ